jgi:hypothetical protein
MAGGRRARKRRRAKAFVKPASTEKLNFLWDARVNADAILLARQRGAEILARGMV